MVRVQHAQLMSFVSQCLRTAGAADSIAEAMATSLVEGDLLGFRTHGVRRLPYNVKQLQSRAMKGQGEVQVLRRRSAIETWDAEGLSGLYVAPKAVRTAIRMARAAGTGTVIVKRCEHVASLAAYLQAATDAGMVISMIAATPAQSSVAPFGGVQRVFSPNPYGFAAPTSGEPLVLDMSFSITAAGKVRQAYDRKEQLPWPAIIAKNGEATADPAEYIERDGAILPLGGTDLGYKGYGLCLMSEILTLGLSNYGRLQGAFDGEMNTLYVHVADPEAFGTRQDFLTVTDDLLRRCRESAPAIPKAAVRIPGERALELKRTQLREGVLLDELTWPRLQHLAQKLNVPLPAATLVELTD
ncbi:Ldh family oxidoreductase [Aliidiomarina sanyensis]|uniref:Lactate dehydrogenase n=1 Tax=Aliidiomarina sanyensis TaxID=1249555 RepID=A0A432WBB3_9GAMM|nr:Ldh family oxidoreductase [Aliidiomarina sanyensis]RUO29074.1 lactate dehydrogenase [Aliidiomarina sanyensis]